MKTMWRPSFVVFVILSLILITGLAVAFTGEQLKIESPGLVIHQYERVDGYYLNICFEFTNTIPFEYNTNGVTGDTNSPCKRGRGYLIAVEICHIHGEFRAVTLDNK